MCPRRLADPGPHGAGDRWRAWAITFAVLALITGADLATGTRTYLVSYLLVVPALGAVLGSPVLVLTSGALAVPLRFVLADADGVADLWHDRRFIDGTGALIVCTLILAATAAVRVRRERRLAAVTSVAEAAQQAILLPPPRTVGRVAVGARYLSAAEGAQVGGDLYEVIETPHGVRAIIGDVSGKGLPAVRTAAVTLGAFREAAHDAADLTELARRVDASVTRHLATMHPPDPGRTDAFVTALFLEFTPGSATLLHRGHLPALLLPTTGELRQLYPPDPAPPLGMRHLAGREPRTWSVPVAPGDVLALVTDGVTEARAHGRFYPLPDQLPALVRSATALPGHLRTGLSRDAVPVAPADFALDLDVAADNIRRDLLRYIGHRRTADDAAIVLLSPLGCSPE